MMLDLKIDPLKIAQEIEEFIRREVEGAGKDGAVVGLSGGVDSALVATLATRALGRDRVWGLLMPERDTDPASVGYAKGLAKGLRIRYEIVKLTAALKRLGVYRLVPSPFFLPRTIQERFVKRRQEALAHALGEKPFAASLKGSREKELNTGVAFLRAKTRLRMLVLYLYAEARNLLVLGTSNRTEWSVGLFAKYGDGAADLMPILHLYKTQVKELASYLRVPAEITQRVPNPDLAPGLSDEFIIGLPYPLLDKILLLLEGGLAAEEIVNSLGVEEKKVQYVRQLMEFSNHMRRPPASLLEGFRDEQRTRG
ncbi:MAG: NAD(+) synthase [Deltaproteobacteria bacterium]|nr:MAG: NAD(+) synthase [Deltaproteobacteria bacterium]